MTAAFPRGCRLLGCIQRFPTPRTRTRIWVPPGVVLVPDHGNLIGGGKDGILYNLDRNNLGHDSGSRSSTCRLSRPTCPMRRTGRPVCRPPPRPIRTGRSSNLIATTPHRRRPARSYHIHGTPIYLEHAGGAIVFVWGENERLKAYNINVGNRSITGFRAQGTQFASGDDACPGGMPGGRLVVSSNGTKPGSAVVWATYPVQGDANSAVVRGALVAYDATAIANGHRPSAIVP